MELSRPGTLIDDLNSWQSLGAIGRLRNAIKWINGSPQRIYRFEDTQKSLWAEKFGWAITPPVRKLILANATRWNSTFDMIVRALDLMEVIIDLLRQEEHRSSRRGDAGDSSSQEIKKHALSDADWKTFITYKQLLAPLAYVTLQLQGKPGNGLYNNISHVYPSLELILDHYEKAQRDYDNRNEAVATAIGRAWLKANDYYEKLDDTLVYAAALILDPRLKLGYIERQ
jgi:hypothetical protein